MTIHVSVKTPLGFLTGMRVLTAAVLAVLERVVVGVLSLTALVSLGACVFFGWIAPHTHFPMGLSLFTSLGSAVLIVLYYATVQWLIPD